MIIKYNLIFTFRNNSSSLNSFTAQLHMNSSTSFKRDLSLFQHLSKKRTIHLRNITSSKSNLIASLKGKLETYSTSIIKFNEFIYNKSHFLFKYTQNASKLTKLNYSIITNLETVFSFLKNNPTLMYNMVSSIKDNTKQKKLSTFIVNNFFSNALSLKSTEDEFLMLMTKLIYEDLTSDSPQGSENMFAKDSIIYYITRLLRNTWEISQFIYELLVLPMNVIEQKEHAIVLDIQSMKSVLKKKATGEKNSKELHEKAVQYLFKTKQSVKFKDVNNFYLNTIIEKAFSYHQVSPMRIADKYPYLFTRHCGISSNTFGEMVEKETNVAIKEYLSLHLKETQSNNTMYSNIGFINIVNNTKESDEIYSLHLTNCTVIIEIIDVIIESLLYNRNAIPLSIQYICKIIEVVYKKKRKDVTEYDIIKLMAQFVFEMLINPVLMDPSLLILFNNGFVPTIQKDSLKNVVHVFNAILTGKLFKDNENHYSKLNIYCMEATCKLIKLFTNLQTSVKLPQFIMEYLNNETKSENCFEYEKWNSNQLLQNNFFMFSIEDAMIFIEGCEQLLNTNNNTKLDKNDKYDVFISSLSNIKELLPSLVNIHNEDCNNKNVNYYIINDLVNINDSSSNKKLQLAGFNEKIVTLMGIIRTLDDLFFEMYDITSMDSFIKNLPFIIKSHQYMLNNNNNNIKIIDDIIELYNSFTEEEKLKCNTTFLNEMNSIFQQELNIPYLTELNSLEEYVSIVDKKNSEYCYLLNLLEDRSICKICKSIIEQHIVPIETIINKPFFNKGFNELQINEVIKKKYKKTPEITETIQEFCDHFSSFTLSDFFTINPNQIIEQYNQSFIPREISKLFTIVNTVLSRKETFLSFSTTDPHISIFANSSSLFIDKITNYIHCRLEPILLKQQPSDIDSQLISQYIFLSKLDINSHFTEIKSNKLAKMENYICSLGQLSSPKDVIGFFANVVNFITDYKPLDKSGTFLIILYYVVKINPFNLNSMLEYITCFYNITDNKMKQVFMMLKKTVTILLKVKSDPLRRKEKKMDFNKGLVDDILTMFIIILGMGNNVQASYLNYSYEMVVGENSKNELIKYIKYEMGMFEDYIAKLKNEDMETRIPKLMFLANAVDILFPIVMKIQETKKKYNYISLKELTRTIFCTMWKIDKDKFYYSIHELSNSLINEYTMEEFIKEHTININNKRP